MDLALRIDGSRSLRHHFHFCPAELPVQRMQLTIHVADANLVQIDQRELPHAAPG
jgi:hypothetical protein